MQANKWAEGTVVTVPIRQLCSESTEFREKLFKTLTPAQNREPEPDPESEPEQRVPLPAAMRRNPPRHAQPRQAQNENDSDSDDMEDTIRVQPPRARVRDVMRKRGGIVANAAEREDAQDGSRLSWSKHSSVPRLTRMSYWTAELLGHW